MSQSARLSCSCHSSLTNIIRPIVHFNLIHQCGLGSTKTIEQGMRGLSINIRPDPSELQRDAFKSPADEFLPPYKFLTYS